MKSLIVLKKLDWFLAFPAFALTSLGIIALYSSSLGGDFLNFKKQVLFFGLGILLMMIAALFDWRTLKANSYLVFTLYLLGILLLAGVLCLGTSVRGVKGWYKLGAFSFDPVPLMTLCLIFVLSKYFSRYHVEIYRLWHLFFSFLYAALPVSLILAQPDFGSALCLLFVWLAVILFSGIKMRHLLVLLVLFGIVFLMSWLFFFQDYQKERLITFLKPAEDLQGKAWNIHQSKIAIGAGGFFGKGLGKGWQARYGFLPEAQTDFIFPAIAEETGFLGASLIFCLYGLLLWRIVKISRACRSNFARLFSLSFGFFLAVRVFINIGMSLGILPVIGLPLPFVSYGGSELLVWYLGLGVLQSFRIYST